MLIFTPGYEKSAPRFVFHNNKDGGWQKSSTAGFADVYPVFPAHILNSSAAWPCNHVQNSGDEKKSYVVCIIQCKEKQTPKKDETYSSPSNPS